MGCWAFRMQGYIVDRSAFLECVEQVFVKCRRGVLEPFCQRSMSTPDPSAGTPAGGGENALRKPWPDAQVLALSSLVQEHRHFLFGLLSPCVAAVARPCSQVRRAPREIAGSLARLPSSFQPAEYFGPALTQRWRCPPPRSASPVQVALAQAEVQQRIVHAFGRIFPDLRSSSRPLPTDVGLLYWPSQAL